MRLSDLVQLRPWAYHVTTPTNFQAIREWRRLRSARSLLADTKFADLLSGRRITTQAVVVENVAVEIRDQLPLMKGHIAFESGFTFERFLEEINTRVFLWPGNEHCPIEIGRHHFGRYSRLGPVVVLRCRLESLIAANASAMLYVARCNSGAPRSNPRAGKALRGRSTYVVPADAAFSAGEVKELSYRDWATLPTETEWSQCLESEDGWARVW